MMWQEKYLNKVTCGDCLELMKELPDESIDLIVTDPPFGINFMCKHWDKAVPPVEVWKECLRVLKPGAFAFVMSLPRQDVLSRMIVNLEDAGFKTNFSSLYHAFARGFPKAMNISKMVDKKMGLEREVIGQKIRGNVEKAKQTGTTFAVAEANKNNKAIFGYGIENLTIPSSNEAKALDGSYGGWQPKPALEVILVVMKPLSEKTYVEQALTNGKGITWLDDGRIPFENNKTPIYAKKRTPNRIYGSGKGTSLECNPANPQGRFPANLLVSDNVLDDGIERKSGTGNKHSKKQTTYFKGLKAGYLGISVGGDTGQFSRFFSLDAWWEKKIKELPESVQKTFPFLLVSKASKSEKNKGLEGMEEKDGRLLSGGSGVNHVKADAFQARKKSTRNHHPTCKPIKLMSYLITLGSREGDTVLDPYIGSGTTAVACKQLNRNFIGFEISQEYIDIANKRLEQYSMQETLNI